MYLASIRTRFTKEYIIRKSIKQNNFYTHIDLFNLGANPAKFIHLTGRNGFYIDENLIEEINKKGVNADQMNIEHIFTPFLPYEIRIILNSFSQRKSPIKNTEKIDINKIHPFDRFRLYYLKFQDQKQTHLNRLPPQFFKELAWKSRDEIEQFFLFQEKSLKQNEIKDYIFSAFNLKYYFTGFFKRTYPELCPEDELDKAFLEQVCNLNSDEIFFKGMQKFNGLNYYLKRYVSMYFDSSFSQNRINEEILKNFTNRNRSYRPFYKRPEDKVFERFFGDSYKNLIKKNKKEIKKIFREKAKKLHPDMGGEESDFNKLCSCYRAIIKEK